MRSWANLVGVVDARDEVFDADSHRQRSVAKGQVRTRAVGQAGEAFVWGRGLGPGRVWGVATALLRNATRGARETARAQLHGGRVWLACISRRR